MQNLKPMKALRRKLLAVLLFPCFVWLLISVLEPIATKGWLGPVPARNLEEGFDAGALFYTEVDVEELLRVDAQDEEHRSRKTQ